jgi:exopolysaccharide transport family protein
MNTLSRPDPPKFGPGQPATRSAPHPVYIDQNELREIFRKLWRRRILILTVTAFLTALGALRLVQIPPTYVATTMLIIEPHSNGPMNVEAMIGGARDSEAIYTEATVLTSRELIGKLVDKLNLGSLPEFNGGEQAPSFLQSFNPLRLFAKSAPPAPAAPPDRNEEQRLAERDGLIDAVLGHLQVSPKPRTRILTLSFDSTNPEVAAQVLNSLADLYLINQLEVKFEATQRVTGWLDVQLNELRLKVEASDRAVAEFRAKADVYGGKDAAPMEQQINDLSAQLATDQTERAAAEARLRNFRDALDTPQGETSISEVPDAPLIQQLRQEESEAQRSIADLSAQYGERHPKLIAARQHLADIQSRLRVEATQHLTSLENVVAVARTREKAVADQIEDLKRRLASWNNSLVKLRALEMEAAANRTLMQNFLSEFKQTSAQENGGIQSPDARILSRANIPSSPSSPNKRGFMALAVALSGLMAIGLAMTAEYLDRGFRSGVQFELHNGVPILGMIPLLPKEKGPPQAHVVNRPGSAYAEAIRSVYASVLLSSSEVPLKTIVVTSSSAREGKTTLALSLSRMMAMNGQKVVLVEADLRHPSIHAQLGIPRRVGLAELLVGEVGLSQALHRDDKSPADILTTGLDGVNPTTLVGSHQMSDLLATLAQRYDRVIIDTPPVLAVSDGWLLSNLADATIFVCQWAATTRETASLGLKELREANAQIIGAVLTMVDMKKSRAYGYADTTYQYSGKKYYTE